MNLIKDFTSKDSVYCCAISENSQQIAQAGASNQINIQEISINIEIQKLRVSKPVTCMEFSSDMKQLIFGCKDNLVHIVDTKSWHEVKCIDTDGFISSLNISSNSELLLFSSEDGNIQLYDLLVRQDIIKKYKIDGDIIQTVAFSQCGKYFGQAGFNKTIQLQDFDADMVVRKVTVQGIINQIKFGDNQHTIQVAGQNMPLTIVDTRYVALNKQLDTKGNCDCVYQIDDVILYGDQKRVVAQNIVDKCVMQEMEQEGFAQTCVLSKDKNYIAQGGKNKKVYLYRNRNLTKPLQVPIDDVSNY